MSQPSLREVIEAVSQEKGIESSILIEATEQAILTAAKRQFGVERELEAEFNGDTGAVDLKMYMTVVEEVDDPETEIALDDARRHGLDDPDNPLTEGDELGFQIFYLASDADEARKQDREFGDLLGIQQARRGFGRIAAQTAKQVIVQRVRDAERERIFREFEAQIGLIISGTVRRFERGSNIIVDIDRTGEGGRTVEAILPHREQTPRESYRPGDRIVALLKNIDREARGPQLILSRTDTLLLQKLFEMEVPEIYEGIVRIVAAARDPGARSKIAVSSRDNDVDPVGACVGMKGSRVQAVVQELRGEKIDIVPFDRDPARFVCNAIAPAEVVRVVIDEANSGMELVVPDSKQSLAIGRRGQNVRLASQLTGWKLDIISESDFQQMEDMALQNLTRIGAGEEIARGLYRIGFRSLDEVVEASDEELLTVEGAHEGQLVEIRSGATRALEELRQEWIQAAAASLDFPTESEKLRLVAGVSERTATMLEKAGYNSLAAIVREDDVDRLAIRTELGAQRCAAVKAAVDAFLANEWPTIESGVEAMMEAERARRAEEAAAAEAAAAEAAAAENAETTEAADEATEEADEA